MNVSRRDCGQGRGLGSRSSVRKILSICKKYFSSVFTRNTLKYLHKILSKNINVSRQDCGRGGGTLSRSGSRPIMMDLPSRHFQYMRKPQVKKISEEKNLDGFHSAFFGWFSLGYFWIIFALPILDGFHLANYDESSLTPF